jgi:hypothetical protein
MRTITKFLVLIPLVALGAACNGNSPGAPDNPMALGEGSSLDPSAKSDFAPPCNNIAGVELKLVQSPGKDQIVHATYVSLSGSTARCSAPVWVSAPRGLLTADPNPFRVRVKPTTGDVTVTATAPNGVAGRLFIPGPANVKADAVCQNVRGVKLTVLPSTNVPNTLVRATYVTLGPSMDVCPAPIWDSSPRGNLVTTKDPWVVGVKTVRPLTISATAPNGVRGSMTLQGKDVSASAACDAVTGVQLRVLPSPTPGVTVVEATYLQFGTSFDKCGAPSWMSDPRGILTSTKNPFQVRVGAARPATVTAIAPNGRRAEITLQK